MPFMVFMSKERKEGNDFIVDVHVTTDFSAAANTDDLEGTVNYEGIYKIVKEEMAIRTKLLERLAQRMLERIQKSFIEVKKIEISVAKKTLQLVERLSNSELP